MKLSWWQQITLGAAVSFLQVLPLRYHINPTLANAISLVIQFLNSLLNGTATLERKQ